MEAAEDRLAGIIGEDKAEEWATAIEAETAKLAQFPAMWPLAEEDKLFRESVRRMLYRRAAPLTECYLSCVKTLRTHRP
jgi:hypothetical protein